MIAVDTNVLVRYLVRDDVEQAEAARALLAGLTPQRPGFVCREVLLETVWVLERAYRFPRARIAIVLLQLVATDSLVFEAVDSIARAALRYRQGGAGFSDLMILATAVRGRSRASLHLRPQSRRDGWGRSGCAKAGMTPTGLGVG